MRIAFIGLGAMGLPMARRLCDAGKVELVLFDNHGPALERATGLGRLASSVEDAVDEADAVFTVLPGDAEVSEVASRVADVARAGQAYVDFSTIGPATMVRVSEELQRAGVKTISLAMTRSTAAAASGELVLFGGGLENMDPELESALGAVSVEVRDVGSPGAAKAMKLANNMVLSGLDVAICEALVLGRALGFGWVPVLEAMKENGADCWPLVNHIERYVLPDDLGPGRFSTRYMAKDVGLFSETALSLGVPSYFAGLVLAYYRGVVANGLGDHYHMVVVHWLEAGAALAARGSTGPHFTGTADASDLVRIARGMAAIQTLVSEDALSVMTRLGLTRGAIAQHLRSGSAGSDYLSRVVDAEGPGERPEFGALAEDLRAVSELAERASVPSAMFETGRRVAVADEVAVGAGERRRGAKEKDA